jgi:hypothetical protein
LCKREREMVVQRGIRKERREDEEGEGKVKRDEG